MSSALAVSTPAPASSVLVRLAHRFGVEPNKMLSTLKETAFKGNVTNEQMMALLVVAEQYHLNPWTREIYAFPDKHNGIVPVVGVDGWSRIINEHAQFDGMEFVDGPSGEKHKQAPEWIECVMYRKDRDHPTKVRERMSECYRDVGPWNSHPARLLRHKAMIQCARLAFGFGGIYDQDEAERVVEGQVIHQETPPALAAINEAVTPKASVTFAQVAEAISTAESPEQLEVATDLARDLPDDQRAELAKLAEERSAVGWEA